MPFDSNGVFSRVMNWTSDQQNGIAIKCGRHDAEDDNFAQGFNDCFCRDGRAAATGDFNLGNYKLKNVADGTASTDAVNKGQLDAKTTPAQVNMAISTMLSTLYPVGSIYIGTQNICPLATLISGSQWQLVGQDRALWGGNGSNANTNIEQSLPDHRHTLTLQTRHGQSGSTYNTAYFSDGNSQTTQTNMTGTTSYASASNSIYGGTRVQPQAYRVNVWRRTA